MNREQIIQIAREAGLDPDLWNYTDAFEAFAKLVAEHEREEIAQFIERTELGSLPDETALQYARLLKSYSSAIRARGDKHD